MLFMDATMLAVPARDCDIRPTAVETALERPPTQPSNAAAVAPLYLDNHSDTVRPHHRGKR